MQETYQKFKQNPPARIKRKAEKQRLEKEEAKRIREAEEQNNQSAIDPTTGQFIPPPPQQQINAMMNQNPPQNGGGDSKQQLVNGDSTKENGDLNSNDDPNDPMDHDGLEDKDDDEKTASADSNNLDQKKTDAAASAGGKNSENMLKIMLSGFVRSEYDELESMVKELGAEVTSQAKFATHLVMPKMGRTISFLCAISYVKFILKPSWIRQSHKEKKLLG